MIKPSLLFLIVAATATSLAAQNRDQQLDQQWDRFRGPNGVGACEVDGIPAVWGESDYAWKVKLPGVGHSSPVAWDDRVYVTSANEDDGAHFVSCFNLADGREVWKRSFPGAVFHKHASNSFATATPAIDKERIYLIWTTPEHFSVIALDRSSGKDVWQRDLGPFVSQHGSGASPIVFEDMLIVPNEQDGISSINALDGATGKTRWTAPRRSAVTAYATPFIFAPADQTAKAAAPQLIITSQAHGVSSLDPRSGKPNWELKVLKHRTVGSPILAAGLIYAACGEGGVGKQMIAAAPPDETKHKAAEVAFNVDAKVPYCVTPIAYRTWIFLWNDQGIITCLDAASGKKIWQQRLGGHFFGSPIRIRDRLYAISQDGQVDVIAAADQYKLLGQTKLDEASQSTPAVADGLLLLRTQSQLFAVGK